jgi:hypothetical protein
MNVKVLDKIEKSYVKLDWLEVIDTLKLTVKDMDNMVDILNTFKKNKSAKEIVICKYKNFPFYVTIKKQEFSDLLDFIEKKFINLELYEKCKLIEDIKSKL